MSTCFLINLPNFTFFVFKKKYVYLFLSAFLPNGVYELGGRFVIYSCCQTSWGSPPQVHSGQNIGPHGRVSIDCSRGLGIYTLGLRRVPCNFASGAQQTRRCGQCLQTRESQTTRAGWAFSAGNTTITLRQTRLTCGPKTR